MFYANYMRERMKNLPKYDEAEGSPAVVCNGLERPIKDINLFGESIQEGTPSPETPTEIVSIENPVVTVTGKNLFDIDNPKLAALNSWAYNFSPKIENGVLYNGGVASQISGVYCCVYCGKKPCTLSLTIEGASGAYYDYITVIQLDSITENGYFVNNNVLTTKRSLRDGRHTLTLQPTKNYVGFAITHETIQHVIKATDIQIEFGDTATGYEPYIQPQSVNLDGITLRGLKDSQGSWKARDEIKVDGKKKTVTFVKRCWEISLDGDAGWAKYDYVSGYEGFMIGRNILPENYNRRTPAFCNQCRVDYNTMWIGVDNKLVYWVGPEARRFYDATLEDKGLANLKAHLNENPLKIVSYYDKPVETDITNTEAGQKLLELYTNKGTTNIFLNSESDLGEIWVRYERK
ncbi:MAG: hypothetical protein IJE62_00355 [Clostridia bacterium]|nr:hypothetical protein [Clostridia bacterium]